MWNELDMPSVEDPLDDWDIPEHDEVWNELWRDTTFDSHEAWLNFVRLHGRKRLQLLNVGTVPPIWDEAA
jgi:hypothetical protein